VPQILEPLRAAAGRLETGEEAAALREAYDRIPSANISRDLLARRPEALMVLAVRDVGWSDLGDADRVVRTLRRFDWRPSWLPAYARAESQTLAAAPLG